MKLICKKSGDPCAQCMKGVIPDVGKCPFLLRMDDAPQPTDKPPAE